MDLYFGALFCVFVGMIFVAAAYIVHRIRPSIDGRLWLSCGAVLAGLAVAANAYLAHAFRPLVVNEAMDLMRRASFGDAVRNQMTHAVALVLVGLLGNVRPTPWCLHFAGSAFLLGIVLFCGGLYIYAIWGFSDFTSIAPAGGISFMVGWTALAIAGWRSCATRS